MRFLSTGAKNGERHWYKFQKGALRDFWLMSATGSPLSGLARSNMNLTDKKPSVRTLSSLTSKIIANEKRKRLGNSAFFSSAKILLGFAYVRCLG